MSTLTLKNTANQDVPYTVIGADMSTMRAVALGVSDADNSLELTVNQQRAPMGSRGSKRCNVKVAHENVVSTTPTVTIHKQSLSLLITVPPSGNLAQAQDEWAALKAYIETRLPSLINGVVVDQ